MRKLEKRKIRHRRIRSKVKGTSTIPRLSVFRSNQYFYGSIVNDDLGETILSVNDKESKKARGKTKTELAYEAGVIIGEKAKKKKIKKVVFDRSGYKFHGRVGAFAQGARKGGLEF